VPRCAADTVLEKAREAIGRFRLLDGDEKVVVAVSGGQDSVALLDVLVRLAAEFRLGLHVAHLNHQLRGIDADRDEALVRRLAGQFGLPCSVERTDARGEAEARRVSIETAAREVRYAFLERVAASENADRIAVGHTATDTAETVLMNLLRGTGVDGLGGIPPRRGAIIRPLILCSREDTAGYCRNRGLEFAVDRSNLAAEGLRNRVRLHLLPLLEQEYAAGVSASLARLAQLASGDAELLRGLAERRLHETILEQTRERIVLDLGGLRHEPEALLRRVVREAMRAVRGHLCDLDAYRHDALVRLIRMEGGTQRVRLAPGLWAERAYDRLVIETGASPDEPPDVAMPFEVPGHVLVWELGCSVEGSVIPASAWAGGKPTSVREAALDSSAAGRRLCVRNWRRGDRFRPLGMSGEKKLQDFFTDEKVPRPDRRRVPIVVGESGAIVWVVGHRIDERAKVTPATRQVLLLQATEAPSDHSTGAR
jgi:tRNA(Ile)-lysidine synthase